MATTTDLGGYTPTAHVNINQPSAAAPPTRTAEPIIPTYQRPPADPAPAPAAEPVHHIGPPANRDQAMAELQRQLEQMRVELESSRSETAAKEAELDTARLAKLRAESGNRSTQHAPTTGQQDLQRNRAIAASGGPARWNQLPLSDRLAAQGLPPASEQTVAEVKQFFGRGSSGAAANGLHARDPRKYAYYRTVAKESKLI